MQVVNIPVMKSMITHVGVRHRDSLMFWGSMGVGKSEGIHQAALEHNGIMVDIRLSQYDSVDLRGIPDPDKATRQTVWYAPATLPFMGNPAFDPDGPLIFLFLDEINSAAPAVSAVAYQLINDRRVGEHMLMDNVVIVAAGNRDNDGGVTNRQPAPLSNRFVHAELVPDVKAWSFWGQQSGKIPAVMIALLNFQPDLLHTYDPKQPTNKAFGTPRSWEKAAKYFLDDDMPKDIKYASISGAVGEANQIQLAAFADIWGSLVPIEDIIKNPTTVPVPEELSVQYAMAVHVSGNMDKVNSDALHKYLDRMNPEMVVLAWTLAINRDEDVTDTNAFLHAYAPKYRALFQDS